MSAVASSHLWFVWAEKLISSALTLYLIWKPGVCTFVLFLQQVDPRAKPLWADGPNELAQN